MLAGNKLTYYTNLFSPHDFKKKRCYNFVLFQKLNENNSIKAIGKTYLTKQTKFCLSEIIGIENSFY